MRSPELGADYIRRATARLAALDALFTAQSWADVVRESQEVVELALKGLLRVAGIEPPRIHDVSEVLAAEHARLPPAVQPHVEALAAGSRTLRRDRELAVGLEGPARDRRDGAEALGDEGEGAARVERRESLRACELAPHADHVELAVRRRDHAARVRDERVRLRVRRHDAERLTAHGRLAGPGVALTQREAEHLDRRIVLELGLREAGRRRHDAEQEQRGVGDSEHAQVVARSREARRVRREREVTGPPRAFGGEQLDARVALARERAGEIPPAHALARRPHRVERRVLRDAERRVEARAEGRLGAGDGPVAVGRAHARAGVRHGARVGAGRRERVGRSHRGRVGAGPRVPAPQRTRAVGQADAGGAVGAHPTARA